MTCRNAKDDVKTGGASSSRDQLGGGPEACPSGIRHIGGAKPDQALVWNVTCRSDAKRDVRAAETTRARVPMRSTVQRHQELTYAAAENPTHPLSRPPLRRKRNY
jgi:hypothetical protein